MTNSSDEKKSCHKDMAVNFLTLVVSGDIHQAYAKYVHAEMRHHNMAFAGDAQSLEKAMMENHQHFPDKILSVQRALEDGDLVAVHSHVRLKSDDAGFAAVHIFRFERDRIIEMWDIGQPVPKDSPNVNGMF